MVKAKKTKPEPAVQPGPIVEQPLLAPLPEESAEKKPKKPVLAILGGEKVITESSDEARELYNQSRFGNLAENGKVELSLLEGFYLMEKGKLLIKNDSNKELTFEAFLKKASR